jgi:hypothetical protein
MNFEDTYSTKGLRRNISDELRKKGIKNEETKCYGQSSQARLYGQ